jgi:hypothetical protein
MEQATVSKVRPQKRSLDILEHTLQPFAGLDCIDDRFRFCTIADIIAVCDA